MKNNKDLTDIAGFVDDELLCECYERREQRKKNRKRLSMVSVTAASLAVIVAVSAILPGALSRKEPVTPAEGTATESTTAEVTTETEALYPWQDGYEGEINGSDGIGGSRVGCPEHGHSDYHSIEGSLISLVGNDAMRKWIDDNKVVGIDGLCTTHCNIKNFIDDFNISREDFDEAVDLTAAPYNIDLLYTKDAEYIDEYYKNKTFIRIKEGRRYLYSELCDAVRDHIQDKQPEIDHLTLWPHGVPELVSAYGIERNILESLIAEVSKDAETFNYDLDMLYNEDGTIKELPVYDADDTERSRRGKLNEEFCRVYEDWGDPADYPADEPEEEKVLIYGEGICTIHHMDYHNYPNLKDKYPERYEEYIDLINSTKKESGDCIFSDYQNVRSAIDFFGLTKEEAIFELGFEFAVHDVDFIMTADPGEVEEYFSDLSARQYDRNKYTNYWYINMMIRRYYSPADESKEVFSAYEAPHMILEAQIPRKELEAIIAEVRRLREPTDLYYLGYYRAFDYNLDMLYNKDGTFKELPPYEGSGPYDRSRWIYTNMLKFCGLIPIE